jgi:hypothetical protein
MNNNRKENLNESMRSNTGSEKEKWLKDYDKDEDEVKKPESKATIQRLKPIKPKSSGFNVYKGMPYEEWEKIRDAWLAQNTF